LLAAGLVAFGLSLDDRVDPLVPALQQPLLLTIHVGAAVLSYAVAGVAFLAAAAEIAQRRAGDRVAALPSAATARAVGHRAVLIAFPILTVAIALGSVWANLAWRSYWSNDPKELAAAATWLVFGAYLHVAARRDRWERLAPWLIVLGFAGVLFTYIGAGLFFIGEHSYGGR
jgi:ABC-type transport system involved in cytochrome c biogenesis permease subunit